MENVITRVTKLKAVKIRTCGFYQEHRYSCAAFDILKYVPCVTPTSLRAKRVMIRTLRPCCCLAMNSYHNILTTGFRSKTLESLVNPQNCRMNHEACSHSLPTEST